MPHAATIPGTLKALGGALLFRRRPLRRLMGNPAPARRLTILIPVLALCVFFVHLFAYQTDDLPGRLLPAMGTAIALTTFWLIVLFSAAEPAFDLLLRSATFDEVELHWWPRWRMASRIGLLNAFIASYIVYTLASSLLVALPGGGIIAMGIAIVWGFAVLMLIVKDWWNNVTTQALVIAAGPAFVFFTTLILLSYPWPFPLAVAVISLAFAPLTMRDLAIRRKARQLAAKLADTPDQKTHAWRSTLEYLHRAGDQKTSQKLLDALHDDESKREALPSWALVRLLAASGQFLEAVDAGLAALDREPDSMPLHLAMAEACLGVRDPDNAAAHAEEALDLAGGSASTEEGSEALLLLALACYNQWEVLSGLHACLRVIDCAHHRPGPLLKRIIREARMLARRFGTGIEEGE